MVDRRTAQGPEIIIGICSSQAAVAISDVAQGGALRKQGIIDMRPIEKFFGGPWFRLVLRCRYIILAVFLAVWAVGVAYLTKVIICIVASFKMITGCCICSDEFRLCHDHEDPSLIPRHTSRYMHH